MNYYLTYIDMIGGNVCSRSDELVVEDLVLDLNLRLVRRGTEQFYLTNKEFMLLKFFMLNPRRVLSRVEIFESVWDRNGMLITNTIDVYVGILRKKIDIPFTKRLIHTVHSVGYRFG